MDADRNAFRDESGSSETLAKHNPNLAGAITSTEITSRFGIVAMNIGENLMDARWKV